MNERIKELAEQASYNIIETDGAPIISREFNKEKFAELIVRECAEVCKKQSFHYAEHNNQGSAASAADVCRILINQHFGVEE